MSNGSESRKIHAHANRIEVWAESPNAHRTNKKKKTPPNLLHQVFQNYKINEIFTLLRLDLNPLCTDFSGMILMLILEICFNFKWNMTLKHLQEL